MEHRANLNDSRSDFTAIYESEKDRIYVIGGNDAKNFYKACEYYDIGIDEWIRMAELNVARDSAACCIFNAKFIYVFSGRIKFSPKEILENILYVNDVDLNRTLMINTIFESINNQ